MDWLSNLINLFSLLISSATRFTVIIGLVIVSGIIGGLSALGRRLIYDRSRGDE